MLSYLLPTHNRPAVLQRTLSALGALGGEAHEAIGGAEVIVVDNASNPAARLPSTLHNGLPLRVIRRDTNEGAAARNIGVEQGRGEWIIMLDDDSYPLDVAHIPRLCDVDHGIAAIGADIFLPDGSREAGGLPEVFIGCGVAIRRDAFLEAGGYDPAFDYYAEEYDLCARLILHGWRIVHDQRFRVRHEKISAGRDMNRILHRLVRNNCWVAQRYAPAHKRDEELGETVSRYARIAMKEYAALGFAMGMDDLLQTLQQQPQREMPVELFDRFTGMAHVRQTLAAHPAIAPGVRVAIVEEGKNAWAIRQTLHEAGAVIVEDHSDADCIMIGTLSPGPMLDAFARWSARSDSTPVICPWPQRGRRVNEAIPPVGAALI
jgi:GT2 family glycosyltransferase